MIQYIVFQLLLSAMCILTTLVVFFPLIGWMSIPLAVIPYLAGVFDGTRNYRKAVYVYFKDKN